MQSAPAFSHSNRKPRMQDIAAKAEVSIGTVSRVLNGKPDVTPELAERVMRIAQSMGYGTRSNDRGNSKRQRSLGSIGYVVDSISETSVMVEPFQQHFIAGIEQTITERGGHLVFSTCRNEVLRDAVPAMIVENLVSGIVLKANHETPEAWIQKISHLIPVVLLMHRDPLHPLSSVMCDNRGAVIQALQYLKALGHTRVGFFYENDVPKPSVHHEERRDAFVKYAPLFGMTLLPEYIQAPTRNVEKGEDLPDVSRVAMRNFMALGEKRPTAILCAADIYAMSIIRQAGEFGLKLPEDLSLIGIMNTDACEFSAPTLTSVSLSEEEVGRAAVDMLQERIERPLASVREMVVGTHLVERGSCTKPASAS